MKLIKLVLVLFLSFAVIFGSFPQIEGSSTQVKMYIKADGSIEGTRNIIRLGDVYSLADNIDGTLVVEKDNIVIDGVGFTLSANSGYGVELDYRHGVTVKNLVVKNAYRAIDLTYADDNTIVGNTVINAERAIYVWWAWRNNITGNTISKASWAIEFFMSPNYWSQENIVSQNTILDSGIGLNIMESNNTFTDNVINCSGTGVSVSGSQNVFRNNTIYSSSKGFTDTSYNNDVDTSNTVNGKPIIYWINHKDKTVPSDVSHVFLSNCTNITVQNLQVTDVTLYKTTGSLITKNTLSDGVCGIKMIESSDNTITFNMISYNGYGLDLTACDNNRIVGNTVISNREAGMLLTGSHGNTIHQNVVANNTVDGGIKLVHSSYNIITENNITENSKWGIRVLGEQYDNVIFHNNFINNKVDDGLQVSMLGASSNTIANPSFWDNGTSGNYWSDYLTRYPNVTEIDSTGIGDTPFYINPNNIDHYPLMEPFDIPEFPTWIVMPLFIAATVSVLAIKKKLEKKKS